MPSRWVREGINDSDKVNQLSWQAECLYRRLINVVDDFGRFDARPAKVKATAFPLRLEKVREADITRWIAECEKAGLIALYAVDGKPYMELFNLGEPRAKESKFPPPPKGIGIPQQMPVDVCKRQQAPTDANGCAHLHRLTINAFRLTPNERPPPAALALVESEKFCKAWAEWRVHRAQKRSKLTPQTEKKQLEAMSKLGPERAVATVEHSIEKGWVGLFEPDAKDRKPEPRKSPDKAVIYE